MLGELNLPKTSGRNELMKKIPKRWLFAAFIAILLLVGLVFALLPSGENRYLSGDKDNDPSLHECNSEQGI
jgi:hypothetical protein